jgi:predicted RNA-binding protein Jag
VSDQPTVTAEGRTLKEAVDLAASQLGVAPAQVQHKLDLSHFRNQFGMTTGTDTVKIIAWARDAQEVAGAEAAHVWVTELVAKMGIEGSVRFRVRENQQADVRIDSESARFLVGKQGRTIKAIRHLLAESVGRQFPTWTFHLDVVGGERDEGREEGRREEGAADGARREGGGRDRDGGRGRDRGERGGRGGRGERGNERSEADVEELKRLARKVAERVRSTGETEIIRKRLNSFERRIVHLAVKEMAGIGSESIKQGEDKVIEVYVLDKDVIGEE